MMNYHNVFLISIVETDNSQIYVLQNNDKHLRDKLFYVENFSCEYSFQNLLVDEFTFNLKTIFLQIV